MWPRDRYVGPGGGLSVGPGGGLYVEPRGGMSVGPGGGLSVGPGGGLSVGPRGGLSVGPGGGISVAPGSAHACVARRRGAAPLPVPPTCTEPETISVALEAVAPIPTLRLIASTLMPSHKIPDSRRPSNDALQLLALASRT
jgi:hypothetical protein